MRPKARNNEILVQELDKELLIYNLKTNKAFSLNETCAMVWRECNGSKTIEEITSILNQQTSGLVTEEVVWLALDNLRKDDLLEESFEIDSKFNGMNRREIIRKVGFASMVAIPLVTSLVAPIAANAQSSCVNPGGQSTGYSFFVLDSGQGTGSCTPNPCSANCAISQSTCCSNQTDWISCSSDGTEVTCNCQCL